MKLIIVWGCLFCLVVFRVSLQAQQPHSAKIRIELKVGGHERPKSLLKHSFHSELKGLRDVVLVEKNPAIRIKIDGMTIETNRFLISIIVLNANGIFLANDLGFAKNRKELREITQKIVSQINESYLSLLRNSKQIVVSNKPSENPSSQLTYSALGQHWILEKLEIGKFIKLEDHSLWEISPYDRSNTQLWLPYEEIFIIESEDENYPYRLMNKNNEDTASAKLIAH